jgi:hypothetical protein
MDDDRWPHVPAIGAHLLIGGLPREAGDDIEVDVVCSCTQFEAILGISAARLLEEPFYVEQLLLPVVEAAFRVHARS